ncbi:MAG: peptide chain release factor 2 [Chlamydiales bacterium]|nr:peptide chain release factor 2 [Chlamydiales bacterium]
MQDPSFWDNSELAKKRIDESNALKEWTVPYQAIKKSLSDLIELSADSAILDDPEMALEVAKEADAIEKELEELELKKMLSQEMDRNSCFLSINAGAGGTESCDWAQMLSRMYQRFAVKRGWQVEMLDSVEGDVAGIKSVTFKIEGAFAYGYLKAEKGVHRLVRISPFDSNAKRHTSFASVDVSPDVGDEAVEIELKSEDIRVDTYRASGAGGQHVNKTDSAVRMTHMPSGIVVSCQSQRSQIQNRESCLKMLRSKLYEKQMQEKEQALAALEGEKKEIAWGSQIRSYVFQPYTLVKDARTKVESGNIQAVMDGEIDLFINSYLKEYGGK